jgi:hypothetical protein
MTSEKSVKNIFENMPTKQKITIAIFVVIVLIIIWQVMGLMGSSAAPPVAANPSSPAITEMSATAPTGQTGSVPVASGKTGDMQMLQSATHSTAPTTVPNAPKEESLPKNELDKAEETYLSQVNDLEKLKVERQIEEQNQAIAAARLATATAEKSTAELLTKPTPLVADTAYANQLVNPTRSGTAVGEEIPALKPQSVVSALPEETPVVAYSVISVSFQLNKWSAVIGAQGKLYNVSVGDILPLDGSVVTSINKNGVVLQKDKKTRKISLISAI